MRYRTYIIVPTVTYGLWRFAEFMLLNEEWKMTFEQRCRKYGYDTERHFVTTDDGYILQIFRLVDKNKDSNNQSRSPVLLQHCLLDSWMGMVSNGEKSPAIYLAKQGFDVWVGNNRGNSYSRHHKTLIPDVDAKYDDYTFEDMGLYDTKAMIQHINNTTKIPKIAFLGISQGGTQMYYALALNNEWFKNHLNLMIAVCSPVNRISPIPKPSDEITPKNIISKLWDTLRFSRYFSNFGKKLTWMMLRLYPEFGRTFGSDVLEGKPEINDVDSWQRISFNQYIPSIL